MLKARASPKSAILISVVWSPESKIFCGFRSLWIILVSWQCRTPSKICLMKCLIIFEDSGACRSRRYLERSKLQNSYTNQILVSVITTSTIFTMFGWSNSCRMEISRRVVDGIPSLKFSIFVFFSATVILLSFRKPLKTEPYAP